MLGFNHEGKSRSIIFNLRYSFNLQYSLYLKRSVHQIADAMKLLYQFCELMLLKIFIRQGFQRRICSMGNRNWY
ncbi:MAG: hypothetical protein EA001_13040 [Oscillatoriales cyanobacterium]|nr:MAG: hypothetical protein EA001_13040 [Oscillatoriales cyanobacterium]